ncbi:hypothetical protein B0A52_09813 [Exophiala mesophila]|uniref:Inhibitor of growth protein N-terminal histone-binding domain-containing protein n=1 Tax=Exophiala mesophila TaxID=212818 RepID=A0A438MS81_EXOME|nr:hypothetical protein B0A52_09813 [Exophiala mesophila]
MADIVNSRAVDPDAQAAVTDFLDYTEYLPADIMRSLTLIRGLDDAYQTTTGLIHDLTLAYGTWPSQNPATRPDPGQLRLQISSHLDAALRARDSSFAEASRLYDEVDRHQNRLRSIIAKLKAIPKPPSRDPTPQPPPSTRTKRSRSGRKIETAGRLTLNPPRGNAVAAALLKRPRGRRVTVPGEVMPPYDPDSPIASTEVSDWDSSPPPPSPPKPVLKIKPLKASASSQRERSAVAQEKLRTTRETTEPQNRPTPPPEDAAIGSKYKPWTYLTEYELYKLRKKMKKNLNWEPSDVMVKRELADRGRGWENYYRSKALATANGTKFVDLDFVEKVLKPSSDDKGTTDKGGKPHKSDKVNESEPQSESDSSDDSESAEESSSPESGDEEQEDDDSSAVDSSVGQEVEKSQATPTQINITSTVTPATRSRQTDKTKKDNKTQTVPKDPPVKSQAALAAQEAELAARRLGDIGSKFRTLFTTPFASALASLGRGASTPTASAIAGKRTTSRPSRKRKAEETPSASISPSAEPDPSRKKQKTAPKPSPLAMSPVSLPGSVSATTTSSVSEAPPQQAQPLPDTQSAGTIKIPLKLTLSSSAAPQSKTPTPAPTIRAASVQRASVVPKTESTPPAPSRPPSRRSAAASVEPQASRRSSRRPSMTPSFVGRRTPGPGGIDASPRTTAAGRRSKRDAPGTLKQSSQDGGAAVSVSKRRTKPMKQTKTTPRSSAALQAENVPQIRVDVDGRQELVDPEEERYCICGDVSWGEMICCELDDKCDFGQWFHMECVELNELPPRTIKWYCPGDRKKLHRGESSNGLVGRGIKGTPAS